MQKRIEYIDVMRGIGILLVAFGHSIADMNNPINRAILSFHMPLFFYVSGLLFHKKSNCVKENLGKFVKHKFFTILVPQITCSCLYLLYSILVYVIVAREKRILDFVTFDLFMWFLVVLFLMELVMFLTLCVTRNSKIHIVIMAFFGGLFFVTPKVHGFWGDLLPKEFSDYLWRTAEQLFGAAFFGYLGMLSRSLIEKYHSCAKYHGWGFWGWLTVCILSLWNTPVGMYANDYGNKFVFLAIALLGIISAVDISLLLEKSKLLAYLGQNSIIVYVTHFRVIDVLFVCSYKLFDTPSGTFPGFIIVFLALSLVEIPIIWLGNKYVPFLFGKRKHHIVPS